MPGVYTWGFILLCLIFVFLYLGKALLQARTTLRLRRRGLRGEAVVVARHVAGTRRGGIAYYLRYRYEYQGHSYEREEDVFAKLYKTSALGTKLSIRYLPQHPNVADLEANGLSPSATVVVVTLCLAMMACLIAGGFLLTQR